MLTTVHVTRTLMITIVLNLLQLFPKQDKIPILIVKIRKRLVRDGLGWESVMPILTIC